MQGLKRVIGIMLVLVGLSTAAHAQTTPEAAQENTNTAQEAEQLPIYKQGWQFILAPYLWVPGVHLDLSRQGRFSGTVVADVPWYNLVPLLFSSVMGGMGRVEIWNGKWGLISETNFIYIGDSFTAGGARELKLAPVRLELSGKLKIWSRLLWQDVGVRYLVGTLPLKADKPIPVVSWELFGGLRYTYYNQDTSLGLAATLSGPLGREQISRGGSFFSSLQLSIPEPFLGMRLGFWFTPELNLLIKVDCGGFGLVAYNNVDSVLEALVGYKVYKNIRVYGGYRGRYAAGSGRAKAIAVHGWFHGPMLGAACSF